MTATCVLDHLRGTYRSIYIEPCQDRIKKHHHTPITNHSTNTSYYKAIDSHHQQHLADMSAMSKVAVAGAAGRVGSVILNQLVEDGFKVTVLNRKGSDHSYPSAVAVVEVDYESPETLVKALEGQDAVISAVGFAGLTQQIPLIHAAVKAGVKRFLPSEYGGDAENPKALSLAPFQGKKAVSDLIKKEAAAGNITYTLVSTGPFLDMALRLGLFADIKNKTIRLWDGGDQPYTTTTLASTAKAISEVLKHPEETKNRNVFVRSTTLTQKALLEKLKKATGPEGWKVETPSTSEALKKAVTNLEKGEIDRLAFIAVVIWAEGYGGYFEKVDNELLGIKELDDAELQNLIDGIVKEVQ
ncbi:putative oxidoreductase CipA-like protein [Hypoxylon sp. FL1857]|nr:putative oxidoreductase CipA-like protein [Hypoxylon sp. FL1857]